MSTRYLAETKGFKLYSLFETVYLKDKSSCRNQTEYEESDKRVAWVYGDPDSALITFDGVYAVVAGCGITIYNIETEESTELFNEPESIEWTEGIYQSAEDQGAYVKFNALTETDKLEIRRLNLITHEVEILS